MLQMMGAKETRTKGMLPWNSWVIPYVFITQLVAAAPLQGYRQLV